MKTDNADGKLIVTTLMKRIPIRRTIFNYRCARNTVFAGITCLLIPFTYQINLKQVTLVSSARLAPH